MQDPPGDEDIMRNVLLGFLSEVDWNVQPIEPIEVLETSLREQSQSQACTQAAPAAAARPWPNRSIVTAPPGTMVTKPEPQPFCVVQAPECLQPPQQQQHRQQQQQQQQQHAPPRQRRRQRGPSSQQKVKELEEQVAEQLSKLQQLSLDNEFMAERVRILELVIKVRDLQLQRIKDIQAGLTHNPFAFSGKDIQHVRDLSPPVLMSGITELTSKVASKLTPLLPAIEQHPELCMGPVPGVTWAALKDGTVPLPEGVQRGRVEAWRELGDLRVQPQVLQDLHELAVQIGHLEHAGQYSYLICPSLLSASSISVHAVDPEQHASWQGLRALVSQSTADRTSAAAAHPAPTSSSACSSASQSAAAAAAAGPGGAGVVLSGAAAGGMGGVLGLGGGGGGLSAGPSAIAPPEHWVELVKHVRLSDQQKLQAAVLRSIVARPLSDIRRQRAQLGAAFAQLHSCSGAAGGWQAPGTHSTHSVRSTRNFDEPTLVESSSLSSGLFAEGAPLQLQNSSGSGDLQRVGTSGSAGLGARGTAGSVGEASGRFGRGSSSQMAAWKDADTLQQEASLLKRLQLTVVKETCLVVLVHEVTASHILSPIQAALKFINTWPYLDDHMAFIDAAGDQYVRKLPASATS